MAVKYQSKDVGPIVYCILDYLVQDLTSAIFKYAVERYHPDLKNLITTDSQQYDQTVLDLLNLNNHDPLISFIGIYHSDISEVVVTLRNIYVIDGEELNKDERIIFLAEQLYITLGGYLNDTSNLKEVFDDLVGFTWSMVLILHYLCKLVVFEELVIEDTFSDDIYNSFYEDGFNMDRPANDLTENLLFELMLRIMQYNAELISLSPLKEQP
jgi:hypothetical protein